MPAWLFPDVVARGGNFITPCAHLEPIIIRYVGAGFKLYVASCPTCILISSDQLDEPAITEDHHGCLSTTLRFNVQLRTHINQINEPQA